MRSVEFANCRVWSVEWKLQSVECGVWIVKCRVSSAE